MSSSRRTVLGLVFAALAVASFWYVQKPNLTHRTFQSFDGTAIAYGVQGEGPPVIFLHAFMIQSHSNWVETKVRGAVVEAGFQFIWMDARGHGLSELVQDPNRYANHAMARDVGALIELLALDAVTVAGYSMGSAVAIQAAGLNPRIRALVLGGTSLGETRPWPSDEREKEVEALRTGQAGFYSSLVDTLGGDRLAYAARLEGDRFPSFSVDDLRSLAASVCVINGEDDADPEPLAALIAGAQWHRVPGDHLSAIWTAPFRDTLVNCLRSMQ